MSNRVNVFEDTVGINTGDADIYGTLVIPEEAWAAVNTELRR